MSSYPPVLIQTFRSGMFLCTLYERAYSAQVSTRSTLKCHHEHAGRRTSEVSRRRATNVSTARNYNTFACVCPEGTYNAQLKHESENIADES